MSLNLKNANNKNKTLILLSGEKIYSVRINLFFQVFLVFSVALVSAFLTYHTTIYLKSQGSIEKKDHKIFLNQAINKNLSTHLNFLIDEINEINQSLSNLGIKKKSEKQTNKQQSTSGQIETEEDLSQVNAKIKETVISLDKSIDENIKTITTTLADVGINEILKQKSIINYKAYKDANLIAKNIDYSITEVASDVLSEAKYKIEYIKIVQDFIKYLPTVAPIKGIKITSGYGVRNHPILHHKIMHHGIDFKGFHKSPIQATANAKVKFAGYSSSFGNVVMLNHGNDIITIYAHLSELKVAMGQTVKKNDVIVLQGSTGRSTGEHLHYEVRYKGKSINPVKFLQLNQLLIEN